MKCPRCGLVTFDHLPQCPRCKESFDLVRPLASGPLGGSRHLLRDEPGIRGKLRDRMHRARLARRKRSENPLAGDTDPDAPDWFNPSATGEGPDDGADSHGPANRARKEGETLDIDDRPTGEETRGGAATLDTDEDVEASDSIDEAELDADVAGFADWREELRERLKRIRARREHEQLVSGLPATDEATETTGATESADRSTEPGLAEHDDAPQTPEESAPNTSLTSKPRLEGTTGGDFLDRLLGDRGGPSREEKLSLDEEVEALAPPTARASADGVSSAAGAPLAEVVDLGEIRIQDSGESTEAVGLETVDSPGAALEKLEIEAGAADAEVEADEENLDAAGIDEIEEENLDAADNDEPEEENLDAADIDEPEEENLDAADIDEPDVVTAEADEGDLDEADLDDADADEPEQGEVGVDLDLVGSVAAKIVDDLDVSDDDDVVPSSQATGLGWSGDDLLTSKTQGVLDPLDELEHAVDEAAAALAAKNDAAASAGKVDTADADAEPETEGRAEAIAEADEPADAASGAAAGAAADDTGAEGGDDATVEAAHDANADATDDKSVTAALAASADAEKGDAEKGDAGEADAEEGIAEEGIAEKRAADKGASEDGDADAPENVAATAPELDFEGVPGTSVRAFPRIDKPDDAAPAPILEWDADDDLPLTAAQKPGSSAGPLGERTAAALCDILILVAIGVAIVSVASSAGGQPFRQVLSEQTLWLGLTWAIFAVGYSIFFVGTCGQTVGRMVMRLRVIGTDQFSVGFSRAAIRLGAWMLSLAPLGAGLLPALRDPERRAAHDRLSGTRVVKA